MVGVQRHLQLLLQLLDLQPVPALHLPALLLAAIVQQRREAFQRLVHRALRLLRVLVKVGGIVGVDGVLDAKARFYEQILEVVEPVAHFFLVEAIGGGRGGDPADTAMKGIEN